MAKISPKKTTPKSAPAVEAAKPVVVSEVVATKKNLFIPKVEATVAPVAPVVVEAAPVVDVAPVVEAPVVEAPVVEAPVVEAPVVEAPVVEAPVVEAPVVVEVTPEPVALGNAEVAGVPDDVSGMETEEETFSTENLHRYERYKVFSQNPHELYYKGKLVYDNHYDRRPVYYYPTHVEIADVRYLYDYLRLINK